MENALIGPEMSVCWVLYVFTKSLGVLDPLGLLLSSFALFGCSSHGVVLLGGRQTNGPDNRQGNCKSWMFSILRPMAGERFVRAEKKTIHLLLTINADCKAKMWLCN